jgi:hypothetical protein
MIQQTAQFFEDLLVTTGGWVVTADTGQTLPSALTAVGTTNTARGYRIYRMNDALQSTFPIFMRVDYATSFNAATAFGVFLTIGTGSDGAGNITNARLSNWKVDQSQTSASAFLIYGSAASNRMSLAAVCAAGHTFGFYLMIERTKDTLGNDTGDGLLMIYGPAWNLNNWNQMTGNRYLIMAGGTQPAAENGFSYILTTQNPTQSVAPGDVGLGTVIHFRGVAQQPGTNMLICCAADVSVDTFINVTLYGATRVFQHLGAGTLVAKRLVGTAGGLSDSNARVLMRYD